MLINTHKGNDMNNITITEIRAHLKAKGATLTKLKIHLNGNDAYEVDNNGDFKIYTAYELKEAFKHGAI